MLHIKTWVVYQVLPLHNNYNKHKTIMKYSEFKSIVTEVVSELKLSQGYNRIPSKNKKKRPDYPDVDKDGNTEEPMEKALKDKKKNKMNEYGGLSQSEIEARIKKDPDFLKKLQAATEKAMKGDTTDLMMIMGGASGMDMKNEYGSPEEEDDVITADPEIEEPQRKVKPRHPLMPPEESPEDAPKFTAKKEGKISVSDIMSRYKTLKK